MKEKIINPVRIGFAETRQQRDKAKFMLALLTLLTLFEMKVCSQSSLKVNIKGQFLKLIESLCRQSCCAVKIGKFRTEFMLCKTGVRQGCPLSPILFNLYINDLLNNLHHTNPNAVKLTNDVKC